VVHDPRDPAAAAASLGWLLKDPVLSDAMGASGRERAVSSFSYDHLAARLQRALDAVGG
jgi:glycosyltransferase involved in cell wall biosynthesis